MTMRLRNEEREVIQAMRASERAYHAIHQYAIKFAGDRQTVTTQELGDAYEEAYE